MADKGEGVWGGQSASRLFGPGKNLDCILNRDGKALEEF